MAREQVFKHLSSIEEKREFPISRLADGNKMTWTYRRPMKCFIFEESTIVDKITDAVEQKPLHLILLARNFAAVDSILYDPNDPIACFTCVQITMSDVHDIVVSGLRRIQKWFQGGTLEALRPQRTRPWRFLFLVQSGNASAFESQRLKGDTNKGEWAGKVHQYVLGLEDQNYIREKIRFERAEHDHVATGGATGTVLNICLKVLLKFLVYGFR